MDGLLDHTLAVQGGARLTEEAGTVRGLHRLAAVHPGGQVDGDARTVFADRGGDVVTGGKPGCAGRDGLVPRRRHEGDDSASGLDSTRAPTGGRRAA